MPLKYTQHSRNIEKPLFQALRSSYCVWESTIWGEERIVMIV